MATSIETIALAELTRRVRLMRDRQREFFAGDRSREALSAAKRAERDVDDHLVICAKILADARGS